MCLVFGHLPVSNDLHTQIVPFFVVVQDENSLIK